MNKSHFNELLQKLHKGNITLKERSLLESWYNQYTAQSQNVITDEDLESSVISMKESLGLSDKPLGRTLWPRFAAAAAVILVLGAGLLYYAKKRLPNDAVLVATTIAPGKNGATLTLANGTKILINDAVVGNIASQSGVKIFKTKEGELIYELTDQGTANIEYNTLTTTRGEQTQVRLPDGSMVFLNATSSLKYPTSFAKSAQRRVSLTGEGYFEVAKNKAQPFVVATAKQEVEVLGTHFNIENYEAEETTTSLLEGAVKIKPITGAPNAVLKPGQQSLLKGGDIAVNTFDPEAVIAWKNGMFMFTKQHLEGILNQVARWYDVTIEYRDESARQEVFDGSISRFQNLSQLLEVLESTGSVHFKLVGRRLIVMK